MLVYVCLVARARFRYPTYASIFFSFIFALNERLVCCLFVWDRRVHCVCSDLFFFYKEFCREKKIIRPANYKT